MNLPWTEAKHAARLASADALWAVETAKTAMETSEETLKLCKRVLLLDMLACLMAILFIYALTRSAKNA